jgi:hypothetical protein
VTASAATGKKSGTRLVAGDVGASQPEGFDRGAGRWEREGAGGEGSRPTQLSEEKLRALGLRSTVDKRGTAS